MPSFVLQLRPDDVLARLFVQTPDGKIVLGWSAHSIQPAELTDLMTGPVRFLDYIMENFISYSVHLRHHEFGSELLATGQGSNLDQFILPQLRHFIKAMGIEISNETP